MWGMEKDERKGNGENKKEFNLVDNNSGVFGQRDEQNKALKKWGENESML